MFSRVLVANRGEIAVRIIRCLRELGSESVAVYTDLDQDSMHVGLADYSVRLGGKGPAAGYLDSEQLLRAVAVSGADGVHPGYGFLSEDPNFAEQTLQQGKAKFIGPSPAAIRLMGDKIRARQHMKEHAVPVVPGVEESLTNYEQLRSVAKQIGYPLLLKAAGGGGGRGMRIVRADSELRENYELCRREAEVAFANSEIFCERYLERPRHIEFQVIRDSFGNCVHLFERECSIQRRYQKLFEEAPSTFLNPKQREHFGQIAVQAAESCDYEGVGTVEFIGEDPEQLFFIEMNTRIQVEHPVTELITGRDLVAEQIKVAYGEKLSFAQKDLTINGWALEARINAEDSEQDFLPSDGTVQKLEWPGGPGVRVDSHLYHGYKIPAEFDSLLAKLIVWGSSRQAALARMERALNELVIEGLAHTGLVHERLIRHTAFIAGDLSTAFLAEHWQQLFANASEAKGSSEQHQALNNAIASVVLVANRFKTDDSLRIEACDTWKNHARLESTGSGGGVWNG